MCKRFLILLGLPLAFAAQAGRSADGIVGCYKDVTNEAMHEVIEFTDHPASGVPHIPLGAMQVLRRSGEMQTAWKTRYWLRDGNDIVLVATNDGVEGVRVTLKRTKKEGLDGFSTQLSATKSEHETGGSRIGRERRVELERTSCEKKS